MKKFGSVTSSYFEMRPRQPSLAIEVWVPCAPREDPTDVRCLGRVEWSLSGDCPLFIPDGALAWIDRGTADCISTALTLCRTYELFLQAAREQG